MKPNGTTTTTAWISIVSDRSRDMAKQRGARKGNFSAGANVGLWALARRRVDEERDHGDESDA